LEPLSKKFPDFDDGPRTSNIIEKFYRRVDLDKEAAKPGDVVLYFVTRYRCKDWRIGFLREDEILFGSSFLGSLIKLGHAAIVSEVETSGFPLKVIGQMGIDGPLFEHPVDQSIRRYGDYWMVFRRK
jgi:hypothetical protein